VTYAVIAVGFDGRAVQQEDVTDVTATLTLNESGEARFSLLNPYFLPWKGQYVIIDQESNDVIWGGVPVKVRRPLGGTVWEVTCRTWEHWLSRVAPLKLNSSGVVVGSTYNPALYENGDVPVGNVLRDLMALIPQTGFTQSPLLPPPAGSGSGFELGEPPEDQSRGSVWDICAPIRDYGIEMGVKWTEVSGTYTPQLLVGDPNLGNDTPIGIWDDDFSGGESEYDGDRLSNRWRVRAGTEDVEMAMPNPNMLLLDGVNDYGDRFTNAADELAALIVRANRLLAATASTRSNWVNVSLPPATILSPGDWITDQEGNSMRLQSVTYTASSTDVTAAEFDPLQLENPMPVATTLSSELRSQRSKMLWMAMRQQIRL
jgi:hypothetical protein